MKWLFSIAIAIAISSPIFAQNECGSLQVLERTRDYNGIIHQTRCYDPFTGIVTLPYVNITAGSINNRIMVDQQAGVDICAKLASAQVLLPPGGTLDATGLQGNLATCSSTFTITKPMRLLFGSATINSAIDPIINIAVSNVRITGLGMAQSVLNQTAQNQNVINIAPGLSNVVIEDLSMITPSVTYANINPIEETNQAHGNCIFAAGTTGSHVANVVVQRNQCTAGNSGVYLQYTDRSRIVNNKFDAPAVITNAPPLTQTLIVGSSSGNIVSSNTYSDTQGTANAVYIKVFGVPNESPTHTVVADNTINGLYQFEAINCACQWSSFVGNSIINSSNATNAVGIAIFEAGSGAQADTASTAHHNSITGNTIQMLGANHNDAILIVDNGSTGDLGADDNTISANVISAVSGHGIGVGGNNLGGAHVGGIRNIVTGNKIDIQQNAHDGVILFNSLDSIVTGNNILTSAASPGNGVNLAGSLRSIVTGNEMTGWNAGIFSTGGQTYNSLVSGNYFRNTGNAIAPSAGSVGVSIWNNFYDGVTTKFQSGTNVFGGIFDPLVMAEEPQGNFTAGAGIDFCYADSTAHAIKCSFNNGTFFPIPQVITATSSAFATATTAGTCVQNTTAVTGATAAMSVNISPVSTPGTGAVWSGFVSSAGNVTINECAVAASAGGTIAFNIRVTP